MKLFDTNENEIGLIDSTRQFARDELNENTVDRDLNNVFDRSLWTKCADTGVLRWPIPQINGGAGHSITTTVKLMEALGEGCEDNGLTFALGAQLWSVQMTLLHFGTDDQVEHYLPGMMRGEEIGAFAITESGSGSDAFSINTTATKDGDHFVLNGDKVMITLAPVADFAIVFASTNPAAGQWGLSAFLVDSGTEGFHRGENSPKMGLRTVPFGSLTFDNCRVPKASLLGREGAGASIFSHSQNWERSLVLAPQVGAMQRLLDKCVEFANQRTRSGVQVGKHQAVSHRIADMHIRLETSRLLISKVAWLLDQNQHCLMEAAVAKTYISEAFVASCHDAIAVHGGAGYMTEQSIERQARDATGATIYGGTVDIQRNIIAGMLGL